MNLAGGSLRGAAALRVRRFGARHISAGSEKVDSEGEGEREVEGVERRGGWGIRRVGEREGGWVRGSLLVLMQLGWA